MHSEVDVIDRQKANCYILKKMHFNCSTNNPKILYIALSILYLLLQYLVFVINRFSTHPCPYSCNLFHSAGQRIWMLAGAYKHYTHQKVSHYYTPCFRCREGRDLSAAVGLFWRTLARPNRTSNGPHSLPPPPLPPSTPASLRGGYINTSIQSVG